MAVVTLELELVFFVMAACCPRKIVINLRNYVVICASIHLRMQLLLLFIIYSAFNSPAECSNNCNKTEN